MRKLPKFLQEYFWDVEFNRINFQGRRIFVLKRILEYGDTKAVQWMQKNFRKVEIKDVLHRFRGFSRKSANFWAVILDIPKKDVLCLRKPSSREPKKVWPY